MKNLATVQKTLDKTINDTLLSLKIEAIADIILTMHSYAKLSDFSILIETSEKKMQDCNYNAKECFQLAFNAEVESNEASFSLKEIMKKFFMFAMKYEPLSFKIEFSVQLEMYNSNEFLNKVCNDNFIKNSKGNFEKVLNVLEQKGQDISQYKYKASKSNKAQQDEEHQQRLLEVNQGFWFNLLQNQA